MAEEKKKGADPAAAQAKKAKPAGNPPKGAPAGKGGGKGKGDKDAKADAKPHVEIKRTAPPRLKELYNKEILPKLMKEFNYTNPQQAPRLVKITLNMGLGEAIGNPKIVDSALEELRLISG
jgi:large subunit ribosomal protein L5